MVSLAQLAACGIGRGGVRWRVANGRLHRLHRAVYAVGHGALPSLGREQAALLAVGSRGVLSHRSAADLWGLLDPTDGPVDVTVPGAGRRSRNGIVLHGSMVSRRDVTRAAGLSVTRPARTLVDIAAVVDDRDLERAVDQAGVRRLAKVGDVRAALDRAGAAAGTGRLRELLDRLGGPRLTRSEAEARLLALLRRSRLPLPSTNVRVARYEVDMLWSSRRLVVEVDGFAFHGTRAAFERDRVRDADLQALGLRVVRITWRQIVDEPEATVARIAGMLATSPEEISRGTA